MGTIGLSMQVIGSLLLIIFLAYFSIRFLGRRSGMMNSHALIKVAHSQQLGQNKSVHAIVVDEKTVLLIGAGAHLETLARFDDPDLAERLLAQQNGQLLAGEGSAVKLVAWLRERTARRKSGKAQEDAFSTLVRQRLEDLQKSRAEHWTQLDPKDQPDATSQSDDSRWPQ
ncbi:MAG: flagellar biosynthetic protein FliO [Firmicutes bacterium]|nr:flagellar biosynthetic protein FliO [Bacillota bacterium]